MPWKLDDNKNVVMQGENPVFVHPDGREEPFNGDSVLIRLGELKNESKDRRQKYSDLKKKVQPLLDSEYAEDLDGFLSKARESIELVKNYKEKGDPTATEIDKIKEGVAELFERRIQDKEKAHLRELETRNNVITEKTKQLHRMLIKSEFDRSDFLKEKTHLIPEMAYDTFGKQFIIEESDGKDPKVFALDDTGEKIFSLQGSKYADPQEAIEILVRAHVQRDKILKSSSGGSGAQGGSGSKQFTGTTIDASDSQAASNNLEKIARGEVVVTR